MDPVFQLKEIQAQYRRAAGIAYSKNDDEKAAQLRKVATQLDSAIELLNENPLPIFSR